MKKIIKKWLGITDLENEKVGNVQQSQLEKRVIKLEEKIDKVNCLRANDYVSEDLMLYKIVGWLRAIADYLKIDIKEEMVEDKSYWKPEVPKMKVWKAKSKPN